MSTVDAGAVVLSRRRTGLRLVVELAVSLAVLVILFRTFLAGGYVIETGSMAPCLVGWHWRATCPSCGNSFAVDGKSAGGRAVCPNCGERGLAVEKGPRNDGDHLLVSRTAFAWRAPRRFEVVVFRNPNKPAQAYVKRVAALPGERLEIRDGDLFVDGRIQAKDYSTQRGMRIPVYDHDCRPSASDPEWQPRLVIERPDGGWTADRGTFHFAGANTPVSENAIEWVHYRHWVRDGGWHKTSVALSRWPDTMPRPVSGAGSLEFDAHAGQLICTGAMPEALQSELLRGAGDSEFRNAVARLYEASHIAAIGDTYGYNRGQGGGGDNDVRDLMISLHAELGKATGLFVVELTDGAEVLRCEFDGTRQELRLRDMRTGKAVRTAALPPSLLQRSALVEFSLMDRQALVAVDSRLAFEPWRYPAPAGRGSTPWRPARWGAVGTSVELRAIRLYRDVYYTSDGSRTEWTLGNDEYFVLGDNSPVSHDSRAWPDQIVLTSDMLLGKPLVVHLPSRRERVQLGGRQIEVRIPEPGRIRYIR